MIFGGSKQATQHTSKSAEEIPVAATTWHEAKVVTQNDNCAKTEQHEHEHRHPRWAHAYLSGDWWGVARRGFSNSVAVHRLRVCVIETMCLVQAMIRLRSLWSGASAGTSFVWRHEAFSVDQKRGFTRGIVLAGLLRDTYSGYRQFRQFCVQPCAVLGRTWRRTCGHSQ